MEIMMRFNRDEITELIPYSLICETMCGSKWGTGRVRRKFLETFSLTERETISRLKAQAYKWHLVTGVPESITMKPKTLDIWQRLAEFCMSI